MYSIRQTATARVLKALAEAGPLSISALARHSELAFSYMFRLLPEMEIDGLVKSERRGRAKIYQPTDYGREMYEILYRRRLLEEKEQMTTLSQPQLKKQLPLLEVLPKMRTRALKLPRKRSKRKVELK